MYSTPILLLERLSWKYIFRDFFYSALLENFLSVKNKEQHMGVEKGKTSKVNGTLKS